MENTQLESKEAEQLSPANCETELKKASTDIAEDAVSAEDCETSIASNDKKGADTAKTDIAHTAPDAVLADVDKSNVPQPANLTAEPPEEKSFVPQPMQPMNCSLGTGGAKLEAVLRRVMGL